MSETRRSGLRGWIFLVLLPLVGCGVIRASKAKTEGRSASLGSFRSSGPVLGARVLAPKICTTGEGQQFLGFDLYDEDSGVVARLVVDPVNGPVARVFDAKAPFDRSVVFRRSECRTFHFSIDATGWRIDRIDELRVSLELDCTLPSGDAITGSAHDDGCR